MTDYTSKSIQKIALSMGVVANISPSSKGGFYWRVTRYSTKKQAVFMVDEGRNETYMESAVESWQAITEYVNSLPKPSPKDTIIINKERPQ